MKSIKIKSIKSKLILSFILIIVLLCSGLSLISIYVSQNSIKKTVTTTLPEIAKQASNSIDTYLTSQLRTVELLAENDKLKNPDTPLDVKLAILQEEAENIKALKISILDNRGNILVSTNNSYNVPPKDSIRKSNQGSSFISDPVISDDGKTTVMMYVAPIKFKDKIVGALSVTQSADELNKYSSNIKFGKSGQCFILSKSGITIAHSNKSMILNSEYTLDSIKTKPELKDLVSVQKNMIDGQVGYGFYNYLGIDKYVGYSPVKSTGWSVGILVEASEAFSDVKTLKLSILIASGVFLFIGTLTILILSVSIANPIKTCSNSLNAMAQGDFSIELPEALLKKHDEIGSMTKSLDSMKKSVSTILNNIKNNSQSLAAETLGISSLSQELTISSHNISTAINDVSKGTLDQAQDLIDINTILQDFNIKLEDMFNLINNVDSSSEEIITLANSSNKDMEQVIKSVGNVNESFQNLSQKIENVEKNISKINEITALINSISDQTNLLALNAAIEAARAGESGRGFSVVAEEIRKLAEQSKTSSFNIAKLITEIAKDTQTMVSTTNLVKSELENQENNISVAINSFETIKYAVDIVAPKITSANTSIKTLTDNKNIIIEKVEGSSSIAEEVSASSEEISASAIEMLRSIENISNALKTLTNMSKDMTESINKFKL